MEPGQALQLLRNGEERGFNYFFKTWYAGLCLFAYTVLKDKKVAEEVVTDALMKLWKRREEAETVEGVRSFLYTVTKNACLNYLRNEKSREGKSKGWLVTADESTPAIDAQMIQAEMMKELYEHFSVLPGQCKTIMEQLYVEGKTPKEIAGSTGLTVNTVRVQKMIGLKKIKASLKNASG